jgi:hypothetical protein
MVAVPVARPVTFACGEVVGAIVTTPAGAAVHVKLVSLVSVEAAVRCAVSPTATEVVSAEMVMEWRGGQAQRSAASPTRPVT